MKPEYLPGSFGAAVVGLGLSWADLASSSGIERTTLYRWALTSQKGRTVKVQNRDHQIEAVFAAMNFEERRQGGDREFTPAMFGLQVVRDEALSAALGAVLDAMAGKDPREQFAIMRDFGRNAKSGIARTAWHLMWKRFCATFYPNTYRNAVKTLPAGVEG